MHHGDFGGSRRGHEGFMHAESAEFAEAHIASLVLAMRDIADSIGATKFSRFQRFA